MLEKFSQKLNQLKENNLYRTLTNYDFKNSTKITKNKRELICFSSNDYLGLAENKEVKNASILATQNFGTSSRASRYICGNNSLYQKLEEKIAQISNQEAALVFPSGYQTAIGVIPALLDENDLILADKLIHSCLIDGAKLSQAKLLRFNHNDIEHAKKLLAENRNKYKNCLIISEKIFSMDGDQGKISELKTLSTKFNCEILVDYAHDLYLKEEKEENIIKMGTFSKALGSFGGYICHNKSTIDYLRNFARSNIYTTALPPSVLASSLKSLEIIEKNNLGEKTLENTRYFCQLLQLPEPESSIVIIEISSSEKALEIKEKTEEKGFLISAIRPPTVKTPRLRITFCSNHKKEEIEKLAEILKDLS